jgi:hypothetical protein
LGLHEAWGYMRLGIAARHVAYHGKVSTTDIASVDLV